MNQIDLKQSVEVVGIHVMDPELISSCSPEQLPSIAHSFELARFTLQKELEKIKALEDKAKHLKSKINEYLEECENNMIERMKKQIKLKTDGGVGYSLKTNNSVRIVDLEKLPQNCIRVKKEADKTLVKTLIELGEIKKEAAVLDTSYSITRKIPKESE